KGADWSPHTRAPADPTRCRASPRAETDHRQDMVDAGGVASPGIERTPPVSPRSHADKTAARAEMDRRRGFEGRRDHGDDPRCPQEWPAHTGPARPLPGEAARNDAEGSDTWRVGAHDDGNPLLVPTRPPRRGAGAGVLRSVLGPRC